VARSIQWAEIGADPPAKKRKHRLLEKRIAKLKQDYHDGLRSLNNYWNAISHVTHNFV
jgi:DNA-binding ferritin-like protein (Dps family)